MQVHENNVKWLREMRGLSWHGSVRAEWGLEEMRWICADVVVGKQEVWQACGTGEEERPDNCEESERLEETSETVCAPIIKNRGKVRSADNEKVYRRIGRKSG
jgi:hypothetical protein